MYDEEKYRRYLNFLGWTEEDLADFFGYKNFTSFKKSSARDRRRREFVGLVEVCASQLIARIEECTVEIDDAILELKERLP